MTQDRTSSRAPLPWSAANRTGLVLAAAMALAGLPGPVHADNAALLTAEAGRQIHSGRTLQLLKSELAQLTLLERSLISRLGEAHEETRAISAAVAAASDRLAAEIERLAAAGADDGTGIPDAVKAERMHGARWSWLGAVAVPALLASLALAGGLGLVGVRRLNRSTGGEAGRGAAVRDVDMPTVTVPLPAAMEGSALLAAARSTVVAPAGALAASIRDLRKQLDLSVPCTPERVVLVTSIAIGDDTPALVASNLAYEMVRAGERTLLVDADAEEAALTHILCPGAVPAAGDGMAQSAMLLDQVTGLWLLPARADGVATTAAEIARLRLVFDSIVVAAPAALSAQGRAMIGSHVGQADQVVLVGNGEGASERLATLAMRTLDLPIEKMVCARISRAGSGHDLDHPSTDGNAPTRALQHAA